MYIIVLFIYVFRPLYFFGCLAVCTIRNDPLNLQHLRFADVRSQRKINGIIHSVWNILSGERIVISVTAVYWQHMA